jgi:hypothetical protein
MINKKISGALSGVLGTVIQNQHKAYNEVWSYPDQGTGYGGYSKKLISPGKYQLIAQDLFFQRFSATWNGVANLSALGRAYAGTANVYITEMTIAGYITTAAAITLSLIDGDNAGNGSNVYIIKLLPNVLNAYTIKFTCPIKLQNGYFDQIMSAVPNNNDWSHITLTGFREPIIN